MFRLRIGIRKHIRTLFYTDETDLLDEIGQRINKDRQDIQDKKLYLVYPCVLYLVYPVLN